jgi:hypothetical protein
MQELRGLDRDVVAHRELDQTKSLRARGPATARQPGGTLTSDFRMGQKPRKFPLVQYNSAAQGSMGVW